MILEGIISLFICEKAVTKKVRPSEHTESRGCWDPDSKDAK